MSNLKAIEIIEERKRRNRRDRLRRIDDFEEKRPDYKLLRLKENELYSQKILADINDYKDRIIKIDKALKEIASRKNRILKEEGLTEDFFKPTPTCPICLDTGYLEDGSMCSCLKEEIKKQSLNEFDLTEHIKEDTFENFDLSLYEEKIKDSEEEESISPIPPRILAETNKKQAEIFCEEFPENNTSLYIFGPVGTGKTFLVNCIVNELLEKGVDLVYLSASNLVHLINDDTINYTATNSSNLERFKNVDLLIIDDLASEYTNRYNANRISEIIDERLVKNKSTIITTNLSPDDLEETLRYPKRMISRIFGCYDFLYYSGKDLRPKVKKNSSQEE